MSEIIECHLDFSSELNPASGASEVVKRRNEDLVHRITVSVRSFLYDYRRYLYPKGEVDFQVESEFRPTPSKEMLTLSIFTPGYKLDSDVSNRLSEILLIELRTKYPELRDRITVDIGPARSTVLTS